MLKIEHYGIIGVKLIIEVVLQEIAAVVWRLVASLKGGRFRGHEGCYS
jgi:hypothetical protein